MLFFRFHRHNVVLPSFINLYFPLSQYCTSLCYHIVFSIVTHFMQNYEGWYTFLNWVFVLFVLTIVYFRLLQCCTSCYESYLYTYFGGTVCISIRLDICISCLYSCVRSFPLWHLFFHANLQETVCTCLN
jgi:hypothetical protein